MHEIPPDFFAASRYFRNHLLYRCVSKNYEVFGQDFSDQHKVIDLKAEFGNSIFLP